MLVGLSIKEALGRVIPDVLASVHNGNGTESLHAGLRAILFLVVVSRFYLGAGLYFDCEPTTEREKVTYGLSSFLGLLHFVLFGAWAFAVDIEKARSDFFILMILVLVWDMAWWLICLKRDPDRQIRIWAWTNFITAIMAWATWVTMGQTPRAELCSFIPVVLVSAIDLAGITRGRNFFQEFFGPKPAQAVLPH